MSDPWVHRLSDYIDDELPVEDRQELELHVGRCTSCSQTLQELQGVVTAAVELEDHFPSTDLWQGIAERIGAETVPEIAPAIIENDVPAVAESNRRFAWTPQLMAAAVVLMMVSAGLGWFGRAWTDDPTTVTLAPIEAEEFVTNATSVNSARELAEALVGLDKQMSELHATFMIVASRLDDETVSMLRGNLVDLDLAITDARSALATNPQDEYLHAHLAGSMLRKVRFLEKANRLASTDI